MNKLDDAALNDLEYLYKAELYPLRIILIVFGIGILTVNTIGLLFKIGRLEWLLIVFTLLFSIFVANKIKNKFIEIVKEFGEPVKAPAFEGNNMVVIIDPKK